MKQAIALCLTLLLLVPAMASATDMRALTMGDVSHIIKDDSNISLWPHTLLSYPDQFSFNVEGDVLYWAGANYALGSSVLGLSFSSVNYNNGYLPWFYEGGLDEKLSLFWAKEMGEMDLGLNLSIHGNSYVVDATDDQTTHQGLGLTVQASLGMMEALDVGVLFRTVSFTDEDASGNTVTEPDGGITIDIGARYWMEKSDTYSLIPYVHFLTTTAGWESGDAATGATMSGTGIWLGIGNNITAMDGILAVADFGISLISATMDSTAGGATTEDKESWNSIPYFSAGLEAGVFSWMNVRFGAVKEWIGLSFEDNDGSKQSWGGALTNFYLGAGFHWGSLEIDAWLDPGIITRGPYLVTGVSSDLAYAASVRYKWGE